MPGIGSLQGGFKTDTVAHFADHDNIGVLTERMFECTGKTVGIQSDFALFKDRLFILELKFDGVLDSYNVFLTVGVDILQYRRHGSGFTAAGGTGDDDDTAFGFGYFVEYSRQTELFKVQYFALDPAESYPDKPPLAMNIHTEAPDFVFAVREVEVAGGFQRLALLGIGCLFDKTVDQRLVGNKVAADHGTVDAVIDRGIFFYMDIGGVIFDRQLQYFVHTCKHKNHLLQLN